MPFTLPSVTIPSYNVIISRIQEFEEALLPFATACTRHGGKPNTTTQHIETYNKHIRHKTRLHYTSFLETNKQT